MRISRFFRPENKRAKEYLAGVCLAVLCGIQPAIGAGTGYDDLDNAAIAVSRPATAGLVAITRAGQRLVAVGLHGVIIYSSDNGRSWQQAAVPTSATLTSVYFDTSRHGYAAGHFGVILTTADGGATWTRAVDGLDVIDALNQASARAQSANPASPDSQLKLRVATAYQNSGPSKPFLAVGQCGDGILAVGQQDMAMYSADGGKSWGEWTSSIDNPTFRNIYAILSDGAATWLVGEDGLVLKSEANCRNFAAAAAPDDATLFGGILGKNGSLLVYGIDGGVYDTGNAAASWTAMPLGIDSVISAGLMIKPGQILLGSLDGNLYLADTDGGGFHQLSTALPFQIAGLDIAPDGSLIAVGNGGVSIVKNPGPK